MLSESSSFYLQVTKELSSQGLTWSFNSPSAPHFGGLWEAAVKSMKHHLRRVITDLSILTPAHFFIQRESFIVPERDLTSEQIPPGKRWNLITQLSQHFWRRWSQEYLSSLQARNKWRSPQASPSVGDLVLIRQENAPPGKWPLGRVTDLHPGSDGMTRVVTLRTGTGTLVRPIVKLVKLHFVN